MSEHPREVEGVLLVRAVDQDAAGERVAGLKAVDRFELRARPAHRIRDVYLDTPDGALAGARVAFRVRELDGRPLLTLKADAVRSGLAAERLELEAPWSAEALQAVLEELRRRGIELPVPAPEGSGEPQGGAPVGRVLGAGEPLADLGALGLRPTQTRETTRTPRDVVDQGAETVAELTLDDVGYQLPAGRARLLEVEVEAKGPGGLETVQAVLEALAEAYPDDLRPWPYGKLATGRAVEQLLAEGRLEGMLDAEDRIRPGAHDLLAEFLSQNSP
jgi:inorganic triphosphatase YgiF